MVCPSGRTELFCLSEEVTPWWDNIPHVDAHALFRNLGARPCVFKNLKLQAQKLDIVYSTEIKESLDATVMEVAPIFETQTQKALSVITGSAVTIISPIRPPWPSQISLRGTDANCSQSSTIDTSQQRYEVEVLGVRLITEAASVSLRRSLQIHKRSDVARTYGTHQWYRKFVVIETTPFIYENPSTPAWWVPIE